MSDPYERDAFGEMVLCVQCGRPLLTRDADMESGVPLHARCVAEYATGEAEYFG